MFFATVTVIVFVAWSDVPDNLPKTVLFVRVVVSVVPITLKFVLAPIPVVAPVPP